MPFRRQDRIAKIRLGLNVAVIFIGLGLVAFAVRQQFVLMTAREAARIARESAATIARLDDMAAKSVRDRAEIHRQNEVSIRERAESRAAIEALTRRVAELERSR